VWLGAWLWWAVAVLFAGCAGRPQPSQPKAVEQADRLARQAADVLAEENWTAAANAWERSARHYQLLNQLTNLAVAWHNEGVARRELGQLPEARRLLERAAKLNDELGETNAWWRNQIALLQLEQLNAPQNAVQRLNLIHGARLSPADPELAALLSHEEGRLALSQGRLENAAMALDRAEAGFATVNNRKGEAAVKVTRARLYRQQSDLGASEQAWRSALEQYEALAYPRGITIALAGLGSCLAAQGARVAEAVRLLERAAENFLSLGLQTEAAATAAELDAVRSKMDHSGPANDR
jgi:tetratricopeptide (TPR) repeat protein